MKKLYFEVIFDEDQKNSGKYKLHDTANMR
jgi:hypothetical protein